MFKRIGVLLLVMLMLILSGCSLVTPVKMEISPVSVTLLTGEAQEFSAKATLPGGSQVLQHNFIWELSDEIGILSSSAGYETTFTAQSEGSCTLTVYSYDRKVFASASISVKEPPVLSSIVIEPSSCIMEDGGTQEFVAKGYDQYSDPFEFTPDWSLAGEIGSLSASSGTRTTFTGANPGPGDEYGTIVASSGAVSAFSSITVTAPPPVLTRIVVNPSSCTATGGGTYEFSAECYDQYSQIFPCEPTWTVTGEIGTLTQHSGTFTMLNALTPTPADTVGSVIATVGAISGSSAVSVTAQPPALARIEVTADKANIVLSETIVLTATGYDQYNSTWPISPAWSAPSDPRLRFNPDLSSVTSCVPTLSQDLIIYASSEGISGNTKVIVAPLPVSYYYSFVHDALYFGAWDYSNSLWSFVPDQNDWIANIRELSIEVAHGMYSGTVTAWCEIKDKDGNWHSLAEQSQQVHNSDVTSRFVWTSPPEWIGLPVNTEYSFHVRDSYERAEGIVTTIVMRIDALRPQL